MKTKQVVYHGNCADGFAAALACYMKFGEEADYVPYDYTMKAPVPSKPGTTYYIVDFSFPFEVMCELAKNPMVQSIYVIDHHKTAKEHMEKFSHWYEHEANFDALVEIVFDLDKSGAVLTWDFLFPSPIPRPKLFDYVQDRDLWKWKLPKSKEINAAIKSLPYDFEVWRSLTKAYDMDPLISQGEGILRYMEQGVALLVRNSWRIVIDRHEVPCVNTSILNSEVGEALCLANPDCKFSASYFDMKDKRIWSLRSRGDFDVSEVAKKFGGGGHVSAAGFSEIMSTKNL